MSTTTPPRTPSGAADGAIPADGGATGEAVLASARATVGSSTLDDAALRRWLHGLPGVDEVGATARAARLGTRSIKTSAKAWALDLAVRCIDLTTLEGADSHGTVRTLCAKARRPDPDDPDCPQV